MKELYIKILGEVDENIRIDNPFGLNFIVAGVQYME